MEKLSKAKDIWSRYTLPLVIVVMFIFCSLYNNSFLSLMNISGLLVEISYMTFLAMGMTFVILTGGIDLSVGAVAGLSSVIIASVMQNMHLANDGLTIFVGVALSLGVCLVIGVLNGLLVTSFNLSPLIVTLSMTWVATGIANTIVKGTPIALAIPGFQNFLTYEVFNFIPVMFIISMVVLGILCYVFSRLRFGREVYAVGSNRYAAYISGMNTKAVLIRSYLISSLFAGIAGLFIAANLCSGYAKAADGYELYTIAAVVMGGVALSGGEGKVLYAFFGVLILRLLGKLVVFLGLSNISGFMEGIIVGAILVLVLFFNSLRKGNK